MVLILNENTIENFIAQVNFDKMGGLVPAIIQDVSSNQVLMQAFMNREALKLTLRKGKMHYWSRSKQRIWMKGETSGNYSIVQNAILDCDKDSILFLVQQIGVCCHTGNDTCFHNPIQPIKKMDLDARIFERIFEVISDRVINPNDESYVSKLVSKGEDAILRKIGEEAIELIIAVKSEGPQRSISEATDLIFHVLILFAQQSLSIKDIFNELQNRHTKKTNIS